MTENTAVVNRQALALFNFMSMKRQNDKCIGNLTLGDFVEMCELIHRLEGVVKDEKHENSINIGLSINDNKRVAQ
jgi:hypothetical protein